LTPDEWDASFNSSVGILSVGTIWRGSGYRTIQAVSIPQSEFCPLGLHCQGASTSSVKFGFNSSVGILSVGTREKWYVVEDLQKVSIPQSEFCPLGHVTYLKFTPMSMGVSIPQSEFCPLGLY